MNSGFLLGAFHEAQGPRDLWQNRHRVELFIFESSSMLCVDRVLIVQGNEAITRIPRLLGLVAEPGEVRPAWKGNGQDVGMHAWIDRAWQLQLLQKTKMIIKGK